MGSISQADPDSLDEQTGELTRTWFDVFDDDERYSLQTNLVGRLATGSVQHTLLFGVDLFRETNNFSGGLGPAPSINIFNPVYGTVRRPDRDELPVAAETNTTTNTLGIYLQDQVTLAENLKLLVGGRFDIVDQDSRSRGAFGDSDTQQQDEAFTPRVGIVYQPIEPLSLYASFSQSFAPNEGTTVDGSLLRGDMKLRKQTESTSWLEDPV